MPHTISVNLRHYLPYTAVCDAEIVSVALFYLVCPPKQVAIY